MTTELKAAHKNQPDEIVWAFDLGKGSIGESPKTHHHRECGDDEGGGEVAGVEREKIGSGHESET